MRPATIDCWRQLLADERGGRVVFLSHCLLNQNVRYLGGATRPGGVAEIADVLREAGIGIVQMPCPEERAWGGVLKTRLLRAYGAPHDWSAPLFRYIFAAGLAWTRHVYRGMARRVARQIDDYQRAGIEVVAVVGIGASPSCGVLSTLDLFAAAPAVAGLDPVGATRAAFNAEVVAPHVVAGRGLFMTELATRLRRAAVAVPLIEHDLVAELDGRSSSAAPELARLCGIRRLSS